MTERAPGSDRDAETAAADPIPVEGLRTYLRCPRRYEFAHVDGLEGEETDREATIDRVALLRRALCDALAETAGDDPAPDPDPETLAERATRRLATLWDDHDEHFHSRAQRRHERRVLEATLEAYVDRVGTDHAAGIGRLEDEREADQPLVGPDLELSTTVQPSSAAADREAGEADADPGPVTLEAPVDYVYADGSSLVAVRFVPTLWSLGYLRYRSDWERVEDRFVDHFDPEADAFDPGPAAALLETAVVLDGLRNYRDRLGLAERTCRYVRIPLADRSNASINWVRETVETEIEVADLTDVYVDHHTFGMTHEHRNETVDRRLESVVGRIRAGAFDPQGSERWADVRAEECPDCAYRVCCGDYLETEVGFDA